MLTRFITLSFGHANGFAAMLVVAATLLPHNVEAEQLETVPTTASQQLATLDNSNCPAQLDATVALASNETDESGYLQQRFAELEIRCPGWPQFAHNQGVLAARLEQWPKAIEHFTRSLTIDTRASMSHRHLQLIFEHRAGVAYARALKTPLPSNKPILKLQTSSNQNPRVSALEHTDKTFRNISTVEYELYAWWQAKGSDLGNEDFYVHDFPKAAMGLGSQKFAAESWNNLQRGISFTEKDAVVILNDPQQNQTLLLMRLVGTRWKIYQETAL